MSHAKTVMKPILPGEEMELTRRELLGCGISLTASVSLAGLLSPSLARAQSAVTKKVVWISMGGGWDLLETTDPKPASTSGIQMVYTWGEARTLAGTQEKIGRWLPNMAAIGADMLVVRGLAMGTTSHDAGSTYMDTGVLSNNGNVNAASISAIVASESDATIPLIQLQGGMTPRVDRGLAKTVSIVRADNLELYRSMYPTRAELIDRRIALLDYLKTSVERVKEETGDHDRLKGISASETKIREQIQTGIGERLQLTDADQVAFSNAARAAGAQAGMGRGGQAFAMALKLIKNDLVTSVNMGIGGFDTHANQDRNLMPVLTDFDRNLRVFVDELRTAGKLDDTVIVLMSDFGRTPKVNMSGGRDHWPVGGSIILGGGLQGGRVIGGTDDNLLAQNVNVETGAVDPAGIQINPTFIGGTVLSLVLGSSILTRRTYLSTIPALTRLKS